MGPQILTLTDVDDFAQLGGQPDPVRDLLGNGLLETFTDEDVIGNTPNRGGKDDPGPYPPCVKHLSL